jgi:hypothetical protein
MDEPEDEPIRARTSQVDSAVAAGQDAEFERQLKLGLEILEQYRGVFEALAK